MSVITSSFNQGSFIARTIDSVLAQDHPDVEHIIVDGMSTDETPQVLARYGHLRVIREPDQGQADAINKGIRAATGQILCFLNSDDTFLPGTLRRVAEEIDPARGRHVVLGRCRFIDEHDRFLGVEHPSAFESHRRVLEIWKGYTIPQPAVFWTPDVWQRCGPLDEREQLMLDYDLFCRFSREYRFHFVDQVFATYRVHSDSKTSSVTDEQRLEQAIQVSRRYWGSPANLQYWRIRASYGVFRFGRRRRALSLLRGAKDAWRGGRRMAALGRAAGGSLLGPDVVGDVLLAPALKFRLRKVSARLRRLIAAPANPPLGPHTLAWRDFEAVHPDQWAGPVMATTIVVEAGQTRCAVAGTTGGFQMPTALELTVLLDGREMVRHLAGPKGEFTVNLSLEGVAAGAHELRVRSNTFVVPHTYMGAEDYRPLSFKLLGITLS